VQNEESDLQSDLVVPASASGFVACGRAQIEKQKKERNWIKKRYKK